MSTQRPPTFETLVHGPPDAHRLIELIDSLAKALYNIDKVVSQAIIEDKDYIYALIAIKTITQEVLGEEEKD